MDRLYRLQIKTTSPWRSLWQSDTLAGMLCWMCVRTMGEEVLQREILEPALSGNPPFVLSDAFSHGFFPMPKSVYAQRWSGNDIKIIKRNPWIKRDVFNHLRLGNPLEISNLPDRCRPFREYSHHHNTIGRDSNTTLEEGGLFSLKDISMCSSSNGNTNQNLLDIYFRVHSDKRQIFWDLFNELSFTGFGADSGTGKGQFEIIEPPTEEPEYNTLTQNSNGVMVLSTFQPSKNDPVDGYWETFTKFGKIGPDFGLDNDEVRKKSLLMLRPGACFFTKSHKEFLGRAVPASELLPDPIRHKLNKPLLHLAYGLAVPIQIPEE